MVLKLLRKYIDWSLTFLYDDFKEGLVVNHIDGDKTNNAVLNLEFTTISGNTKHAYDIGLIKTGVDHSISKQIVLYDNSGNMISQYETVKDFEECTGINRTTRLDYMNRGILDIEEVFILDYNKPVNLRLNKIFNVHAPLKLLDENFNTISLYTSYSKLEQCTGIPRSKPRGLNPGEYCSYTKHYKENERTFYIEKLTLIDYMVDICTISNMTID